MVLGGCRMELVLGGKMEELKFTQEQLDALINERVEESKRGLLTEDEFNKKLTSEVDRRVETGIQKGLETHKSKWQKELEERAKMSADELAQKTIEEKSQELSAKEREIAKRANLLDAKSLLAENSIPKSYYEKFIGVLVTDDSEATIQNVNSFIEVYNSTKADIENEVKSQYTNVPKPNTPSQSGTVSKEDFLKMGYAEKVKFKAENPELYKKFIK